MLNRKHIIIGHGTVYEIYAAERPAVRSYPAPARVDLHTPLVWRPVANDVRIAN
jgi:hypothetical protein